MGFYSEWILPTLIDRACCRPEMMEVRREVVPQARGVVLEVGAGSGLNFKLYPWSNIEKVLAVEPSAGMRRRAERKGRMKGSEPVEWLPTTVESIELPVDSVDTVVLTFTLCSIRDLEVALGSVRKVLKPEGKLLFCEHGLAPEPSVQRWQTALNPIWRCVAGGCQLTRAVDRCLTAAGFEIQELNCRYLDHLPKFAGYVYSGWAQKS